ncbi:MAG TPA: Ig-like domain-containing protein [Gemmatimonadaceae bacterium]|nr:Ig-like domain-containing protein [Gemmatimonadaceae bacterium]
MRRVLFMLTALVAGCSGNEATAPVPVPTMSVRSITIESPEHLEVGATAQFKAILRDVSGNILSNRPVQWKSSDESLATVDQSGFVTALVDGYMFITATSEGKVGAASLRIDAVPLKCSPERKNVCAADETFALRSVGDQALPVHSPWGLGDWDYDDDAGTWDLTRWTMTFYPEGGFYSEMIHRAASGATIVEKSAGKYVRSANSIFFSVHGSNYSMTVAGDSLTTPPGFGRKFTFVRVLNPIGQ